MSISLKQTGQSVRLAAQPGVRTDQPKVTEEQIRRRAYQLYVARGKKPGDPLRDWLQAEKELRTGRVEH